MSSPRRGPKQARLRIAVVDYGAGNLVSLDQALRVVGAEPSLVDTPAALAHVQALIVPGVGAAAPAMSWLRKRGLADAIAGWIGAGRPYLGICLGLQLLFDGSDEDDAQTFGILPGRNRRLTAPTVPHLGWNQVERVAEHPLFDGIPDGADFAFVHSYAPEPAPEAAGVVLARTTHGRPFVSAVARGPLLGVQFHPERSAHDGLRLLANFVRLAA